MITSFLFNALWGAISLLLIPVSLLPDAALPSGLTSALTATGGALAFAEMVIPVPDLILVIAGVFVVDNYVLLWKIINWGIRKIPFIS